ncbi:hypothetical protein [Flexivirga caeni]|uniref:Peptidase S11 D-alanyl-D-alanine carboxypeptidase A N-terminal domain-containing protein n=1 Tax=Flexivirga caeni TaxID=2294115 RepID=A0A3M9MH53_9MICO|nr:hypothetical protein [Flexivirga caeni]RNI24824.1 hypothetical protein EFY87_03795 [Flexivirga caeni]
MLGVGVVTLGLYAVFACVRPVPAPRITLDPALAPAASRPHLAWPARGQAALAAAGYGVLAVHGKQTPTPTASIAKVITALCVLAKDPLGPGQHGPTYTITTADANAYHTEAAHGDSVAAVTAGEHLSEYQALQALLVPSADNVADSLARWVFGSLPGYRRYATRFLLAHGLAHTRIGPDASGLDPHTTSTADDLAKLALIATGNRVLMQIAGQHSVDLPVAGRVTNWNTDLGTAGITGLKTGNNTVDTGAFLFTSTVSDGTRTLPVAGVILDAPSLPDALHAATRLVRSLHVGFRQVTIPARRRVGTLTTTRGQPVPITTTEPITLLRWQAAPVTMTVRSIPGRTRGDAGTLQVSAGPQMRETDLEPLRVMPGPSLWWRLTHP